MTSEQLRYIFREKTNNFDKITIRLATFFLTILSDTTHYTYDETLFIKQPYGALECVDIGSILSVTIEYKKKEKKSDDNVEFWDYRL